MKLIAGHLILALILGSLPANVWACGLNLCPMDHQQGDDKVTEEMPCHQQTPVVKKQSSANEDSFRGEKVCNCSSEYLGDAYALAKPLQLDKQIKDFLVSKTSSFVSKSITSSIYRFYRPPPRAPSVALHLLKQVFII